jgi:hypothetical protein
MASNLSRSSVLHIFIECLALCTVYQTSEVNKEQKNNIKKYLKLIRYLAFNCKLY